MEYLFLDLETFYDDVYSLRKMTPLEYALDPRFEALGCGFAAIDGRSWWVEGPNLPAFFETVDWPNTFAISHNASFDMVVLSFRYGKVAGMYGDTLAMARNQLAHKLRSQSLEKVCEYYGMPAKMIATLNRMKGVNFHALSWNPALHQDLRFYGQDDALKCREIFARLIEGGFPADELDVIDLVVRMAAIPQLELDGIVLAEHLAEVQAQKAALLDAAQVTGGVGSLMSDEQFAQKLIFAGVKEMPRKVSKVTGKEQWAFAKTDKAFTALLEHPKPIVQALVAARLGHKSTLEESRTSRLLSISQYSPMAPVPLKYSGAHTHRFSGDWKINLQNLPNGSRLRRAFKAPKGKAVVSVDASQIEARLNAVLSGQDDLVEDFRNGVDVYSKFAEQDVYHYPVSKANKIERFVGKTGILSLGYGSSAPVFQNMVRVKSDPAHPVILTDRESAEIVAAYRSRFKYIVQNWAFANNVALPHMRAAAPLLWGPVIAKGNQILLPSGNRLYYMDLHQEVDPDTEFRRSSVRWVFKRADQPIHVYGAKLVENVIQALAFVHIMEVAKRVHEITERLLFPAHQVHDELVYVVDEHLAEDVAELVRLEMSKPPEWMPNAPLAAEAHIGSSYGDLK